MEEDKLIKSKKILTDYMLELNNDIQSAEEWCNTGADEEMYFALQTVLNELERLQKEYERLKEKHKIICELNVGLLENTKECIPKQVIRDKIEEIENSGIWITEDCFFDGETDNLICQQEFKKYEMEEYIINLLRKLLGE